jgi:deoxycytidylate deaminase
MVAKIQNIEYPEIFFGFVAPIGVDVQSSVSGFKKILSSFGYNVVEIKVTSIFENLKQTFKPPTKLETRPLFERYESHIGYGNHLRGKFEDDAILAALTIGRIFRSRPAEQAEKKLKPFTRTCYLLHQFKRKEEIDLLRSVYGQFFFQVSIYSRRGARVDYLAHKFANSENSGFIDRFRERAEGLVQKDQIESDVAHGQRISKVFAEGDFIINTDIQEPSTLEQIERFCELLFGSNSISPNKSEYGMFVAKAAALRTLDLSRQVGAAVFSLEGEIVSIGSNEVPKGNGGTYWSDDQYDDREFRREEDSNDRRKKEILTEIVNILKLNLDDVLKNKSIQDSQFMDALEYGRIVHAEMSAISDAARLGRPLKNSLLYCTTFPCHMCAKHIVAAGVSKVVFLEPYPKSLVLDLHSDSIVIEKGERGKYQSYPCVEFEHFSGISPRRYRELFERSKRKNDDGKFVPYLDGEKKPVIKAGYMFYERFEKQIYDEYLRNIFNDKGIDIGILERGRAGVADAANSSSKRKPRETAAQVVPSKEKPRRSTVGGNPPAKTPRQRGGRNKPAAGDDAGS